MADVALVSLALDSTAVVAGEKQATRSLQLVDSAMQRTEKQSQQLNTGLNANLKRSGDAFKGLGDSASRAGAALQGIGGPIGRLGGEIGSLGGQMEALTGNLGLVGGAALAAVAGVTALGSALVKLTLDGAKVSDSLGDIAESTNLSIDTVTRLAAAMRLSGEDVSGAERAFKTFADAVVSAKDPTSAAAAALKVFGIDAATAAGDIEQAFIGALLQLKQVRGTVEGVAASNVLLGRNVGALTRGVDQLNAVFGQSRDVLENSFIIPTQAGIEAGQRLDAQLNKLNNTWIVFTQNLAGTSVGAAIEHSLSRGITALSTVLAILERIERNPYGKLILGGVALSLGGAFVGAPKETRLPTQIPGGADQDIGLRLQKSAAQIAKEFRDSIKPLRLPSGGSAAARGVSLPFAAFTTDQALQALNKGMEQVEANAKGVADGFAAINARFLEILGGRVGNIISGVPLAQQPGLIQRGGPGQPIPGGPVFTGAPRPEDIRTEEQARLDAQFDAIFDDMLISIITAQKTLGGAFAGLALGIVDIFAAEFTKSLRESFITPLIRDLTDFLSEGLKDLFSGLKGSGGLKGVFGGIVKGIGSIFGGFFASGGTLGPGKFGIAGERGPELIFAGNQPMHIAPVTAGSAGNVFNISVGVNAPSGSVDKRTQDQLAATVMNAVKRAQRNEGAR